MVTLDRRLPNQTLWDVFDLHWFHSIIAPSVLAVSNWRK
jgi:hypothetical protein